MIFIILFTKHSSAQVPFHIHDGYGRTVILHGQNTAGSAKNSPDHQPWIHEEDVEREHRDFGFNCVRYLIFWGAIEPEKDKYDTAYLRKVKERVQWYTDRKMYVIFDMHQDVYGYGVGDNGAPEWASSPTKIKNLIPDKWPWWMQNLEPKVINSYVQFFKYRKRQELQQHYIAAWLKVIDMFRDNPYVLGYDLMNEPHGGKVAKTVLGGFERTWLRDFYKRLIPAIRERDTFRYIFVEPRSFGVNFGMRSYLPKVEDTIVHKLVYAPHCYMTFVDVGGDYKPKHKRSLHTWFKRRNEEAIKQEAPMLLGEFGLSPNKKDFDHYLQDILAGIDQRQASWTYWGSDPGGWGPLNKDKTPSPILAQLVRVYPEAVAGGLISYSYEPATQVFQMLYVTNNNIKAPTVISVPKSIYPHGYKLKITGTTAYTLDKDQSNNTLLIYITEDKARVSIEISKK